MMCTLCNFQIIHIQRLLRYQLRSMKHPQEETEVITGDCEENKQQTNAQLRTDVYITGRPLDSGAL